jgi:1,4-dihydroxy-6-naphthoate synthase
MLTTAYLTLRLCLPEFEPVPTAFDQIEESVTTGLVDAGLLIHEGQLTYADADLHLIADMGSWWLGETGLPLPLGGNVVRKDLGQALMRKISRHLRESIAYGLEHRKEALGYAMKYARGLEIARADEFVGMYVNDWTLDYGEAGRAAVHELLSRGVKAGVIPRAATVEFVQ